MMFKKKWKRNILSQQGYPSQVYENDIKPYMKHFTKRVNWFKSVSNDAYKIKMNSQMIVVFCDRKL